MFTEQRPGIVSGQIQDASKLAARLRCKVGNVSVKDHTTSASDDA